MKILFHHRIASFDGQAIHIRELVAALRHCGAEVVLVGPPVFRDLRVGASFGIVHGLKRRLPRAIYESLEAAYALPVYIRLLAAWLRHRPDILYERHTLFMPAGAWLRHTVGVPLLLEVNAPHLQERAADGGVALRRLAAWSERFALRSADRVLPVSGVLARMLRPLGAAEERIVVVANGVATERFAAAPSPADAKRALGLGARTVVGFTGFPRRWHRLDLVVRLIARIGAERDLHLLVVGDGPDRQALLAEAASVGVGDRLTITGAVAPERMPEFVAAFDIAVQPGATPYASPLKLFEYMALGKAIVAPDMANIREILTDGENALLFDPANPEALTAAVVALADDSDLRRRLGAAAEARLREAGYSWKANAHRILQLGCRLMETRDVS